MKAKFNTKINRTIVRTGALIQKTEHYMNYPTLYEEGLQFNLAYHHDRVYFNYCSYNNNGWVGFGTQVPLNVVKNEDWLKAAQIAFRRDKKVGIINKDYQFI
jgi:hypothetical protein